MPVRQIPPCAGSAVVLRCDTMNRTARKRFGAKVAAWLQRNSLAVLPDEQGELVRCVDEEIGQGRAGCACVGEQLHQVIDQWDGERNARPQVRVEKAGGVFEKCEMMNYGRLPVVQWVAEEELLRSIEKVEGRDEEERKVSRVV